MVVNRITTMGGRAGGGAGGGFGGFKSKAEWERAVEDYKRKQLLAETLKNGTHPYVTPQGQEKKYYVFENKNKKKTISWLGSDTKGGPVRISTKQLGKYEFEAEVGKFSSLGFTESKTPVWGVWDRK